MSSGLKVPLRHQEDMPEYLTASPARASHSVSGQNLASQNAEIISCNEQLCFGSSGAYLLAYSCTVLFLSCHITVINHACSEEQALSNLLRKKTDLWFRPLLGCWTVTASILQVVCRMFLLHSILNPLHTPPAESILFAPGPSRYSESVQFAQ